ncbi:unannotated protein [freshwater metagenome]|uniref:Unannotated protein n=1 Tax=freshwater metagenome TaxID=449393 RepID=A0A6J7AED1_9ZZZZ
MNPLPSLHMQSAGAVMDSHLLAPVVGASVLGASDAGAASALITVVSLNAGVEEVVVSLLHAASTPHTTPNAIRVRNLLFTRVMPASVPFPPGRLSVVERDRYPVDHQVVELAHTGAGPAVDHPGGR